eukprot:SAG31_NODE_5784_length_2330_cov_2.435679_1_plen_431_part_10
MQRTGSFKERGARNALMMLRDRFEVPGATPAVVTASAGNHALALAYHARELGIDCTCVMPKSAPLTKVSRCRELEAAVILHGDHIGIAREKAMELVAGDSEGRCMTLSHMHTRHLRHDTHFLSSTRRRSPLVMRRTSYINGYDDPDIIAGAGTMALEILEQCPDIEALVCPVGGGGLIAGMSLAIKTLKPSVEIIGVEPEECPSLTAALAAGEVVTVPYTGTLADGLAVPKMGSNAFQICRQHVNKVVTVPEATIALAVLRLLENRNILIEGGGGAGFAALLHPNLLPELRDKTVCVPLCGGNIDITTVSRVIDRGLVADSRLIKFVTVRGSRSFVLYRLLFGQLISTKGFVVPMVVFASGLVRSAWRVSKAHGSCGRDWSVDSRSAARARVDAIGYFRSTSAVHCGNVRGRAYGAAAGCTGRGGVCNNMA